MPLCEVRVFSRRHHFAGTLDVLGVWRRAGALIDYKSGRPEDVAADMQTAAYYGALMEMIERGDTSDMLTFEPVRHRYTLDGVAMPSVTQILKAHGLIDFSHVPPDILEAARQRGARVHQAAHYFNENDLDAAHFRRRWPDDWPYLQAWIDFRVTSGFVLADTFAEVGALSHVKRYAVQLQASGVPKVECYTEPSDYARFLGYRHRQVSYD